MGQSYYWKGGGLTNAWEDYISNAGNYNWYFDIALTIPATQAPLSGTDEVYFTPSATNPAAMLSGHTIGVFDTTGQTTTSLDMTADPNWALNFTVSVRIAFGNTSVTGWRYIDNGSNCQTADFYGNTILSGTITAANGLVFHDTSVFSGMQINGVNTFNNSSYTSSGIINGVCHINSVGANWTGTTSSFEDVYVNCPDSLINLSAASFDGILYLSNTTVQVIINSSISVKVDPAIIPATSNVKLGTVYNGGQSVGTAADSAFGPFPVTTKSVGPYPVTSAGVGPYALH